MVDWKKEIKLSDLVRRRESGPLEEDLGPVEETEQASATPFWKKEITLGRKKPDAAEEKPKRPGRERRRRREEQPAAPVSQPVIEPPAPPPPAEPTWEAVPSVADEPWGAPAQLPVEPVPASPPEPALHLVPAETPAPEPVAEQPAAHDPSGYEWLTAGFDAPAEPAAPAAPVVPEPPAVVPEPAAPVAPVQPPAPLQPMPAPQPAPVLAEVPPRAPGIHPPVPAAELPPLPEEAKEKRSLLKTELSFRRKPKAEREPRERKPKETRAKKPKEPKPPKEPKRRSTAAEAEAPAPRRAKKEKGAQKAKRLVGLKVGASQLAAARVVNNGVAEVVQVARHPLEPGIVVGGELREPEALAEALREFFNRNKLPKRGVRLGVANNRIGVRTFEIAGIDDPKQLANAIRFRAQEALPIPIEEAVLDYQILGESVDEEGKVSKKILLVVAYRDLVDRYVAACKKAGITLVGIDLEAFALLRSLAPPLDEPNPDAALVAVSIGHERSTFAVSDGRVCEFTRVLEWGGSAIGVAIARALDISPSEAEPVKHALSLVDETVPEGLTADQVARARDAVRRQIQSFARELVSSLQFYQNQPGSLGIGELILTGGTIHLPGLAEELQRLIGVRVRIGDPLARVRVAKRVGEPEQLGSLAIAIGLGIED